MLLVLLSFHTSSPTGSRVATLLELEECHIYFWPNIENTNKVFQSFSRKITTLLHALNPIVKACFTSMIWADDPPIQRFGRSKRRWIKLMSETLHCHGAWWSSLVRFPKFSEDSRQTYCDVPLKTEHPTMLKWIFHFSAEVSF